MACCLTVPRHYLNQCSLIKRYRLAFTQEQFHECSWNWSVTRVRRLHFSTHWGRVTHICVSKLNVIGSDNGLSPGPRRQAIIWTNAGILLIRTLGTNFSEIWNEIHAFSFKKMRLKMSSAKWRPFCLGLHVLKSLPHLPGTCQELIFPGT